VLKGAWDEGNQVVCRGNKGGSLVVKRKEEETGLQDGTDTKHSGIVTETTEKAQNYQISERQKNLQMSSPGAYNNLPARDGSKGGYSISSRSREVG